MLIIVFGNFYKSVCSSAPEGVVSTRHVVEALLLLVYVSYKSVTTVQSALIECKRLVDLTSSYTASS